MTSDTSNSTYNICALPAKRISGAPIPALLARDLLLVGALLAIPLVADQWLLATNNLWLAIASALIGVLAGLRANALFHEWGHFAGVRLFGGHAPTNALWPLFPMFHFDMASNNHRQFMAMSIGGTVTEWLFPLGLLLLLGTDTAGRTGLVTGAFAVAIFGLLVEGPIIVDAYRRGDGHAAWVDYLQHRDASLSRARYTGVPIVLVLAGLLFSL